jgi:hypothetical protein
VGNEATRIIQDLLTRPRPGGLAGIQTTQGSAFGQGAGSTFGGGIAGVASKSEARGIKVVAERENYNEWEFVYDYRKDPLIAGGMGMSGLPGQTGMGTAPGVGQPGFGAQSGFGQQQGLGQPGFGQPGFPPGQVPITPVNPMQPGLPGSRFGAPPGARPGPQQQPRP